jgi:hypothetical protein
MLLNQIIGHVVEVDHWHAIHRAIGWIVELIFILAEATWCIVKWLRFVIATGNGSSELLDSPRPFPLIEVADIIIVNPAALAFVVCYKGLARKG